MAELRRAEALRFETPRLEPDDAFVQRLADAARASRPSAAAPRHLHGLRVGLATAGVVGLTVGGAWAAGSLVEREDHAPGPPPATESDPPISAETDAVPPGAPPSSVVPSERGDRDQGRGTGQGPGKDRGESEGRDLGVDGDRPGRGSGNDVGRPDHPGDRGNGKGRYLGSGALPGQGPHGNRGQGDEHRAERADSGGPQGNGGGRRPHRPR